MKTTTIVPKCLSGASAGPRAAPGVRTRSHTPLRHAVGASRPAPDGPDELMYFESLQSGQSGDSRQSADSEPADHAQPPRPLALRPRVLHVDADQNTVKVLTALVAPEAVVTCAPTLADARRLLATEVFSLVVLDPALPDGDARSLLPLLAGTPLLVYSAMQPEWRGISPAFLPKPWTSARQLWIAISGLLGIPSSLTAGD